MLNSFCFFGVCHVIDARGTWGRPGPTSVSLGVLPTHPPHPGPQVAESLRWKGPWLLMCRSQEHSYPQALSQDWEGCFWSGMVMTLEEYVYVCMRAKSLSCVWLFAVPWTVAHQVLLSMGFSRQEYWSGLPFASPEDLPNPGIKPSSLTSPALAGGFFTTSAAWEALSRVYGLHI